MHNYSVEGCEARLCNTRFATHENIKMPIGKKTIMRKQNSLSAVLKDFQLAPVQFCAVQLGDGILHVAA